MAQWVRIALTGDVMLGRLVDQHVIQQPRLPPAYVWGDLLPLLAEADLCLINLECVISTRGRRWRPATKPFHFRAHPRAIDVLHAADIDGVTVANNHVLDYGPEALLDCLDLLDQARIRHAGAGHSLAEALAPAYFATALGRIAVLALTDDMRAWGATPDQPGLNYAAYDSSGLIEPYRSRIQRVLDDARRHADRVIISAHVGPNWGPPSPAMQAMAHDLIERGADLYWGHSNHTPLGIEAYHGKPILYATGDFIDDYAIDPAERNDLSFLFVVELTPHGVQRIVLHPVKIDRLRVQRVAGAEAHWLMERMRERSAALGSHIALHEDYAELRLV
ncbi:MAG TPA: CapA family protein [Herpetosiphonaceae bacterium]